MEKPDQPLFFHRQLMSAEIERGEPVLDYADLVIGPSLTPAPKQRTSRVIDVHRPPSEKDRKQNQNSIKMTADPPYVGRSREPQIQKPQKVSWAQERSNFGLLNSGCPAETAADTLKLIQRATHQENILHLPFIKPMLTQPRQLGSSEQCRGAPPQPRRGEAVKEASQTPTKNDFGTKQYVIKLVGMVSPPLSTNNILQTKTDPQQCSSKVAPREPDSSKSRIFRTAICLRDHPREKSLAGNKWKVKLDRISPIEELSLHKKDPSSFADSQEDLGKKQRRREPVKKYTGFKRIKDVDYIHDGYDTLERLTAELQTLTVQSLKGPSSGKQSVWNRISALKSRLRNRELCLAFESHSKRKDKLSKKILEEIEDVAGEAQLAEILRKVSSKWKAFEDGQLAKQPFQLCHSKAIIKGVHRPKPADKPPCSECKCQDHFPSAGRGQENVEDLVRDFSTPSFVFTYFQRNGEEGE